MGCDIMTVKCPTCVRVSSGFGEWIGDHAEDFDIRYCSVAPTREIVEHLRQVAKTSEVNGDVEVAKTLLAEMGYEVEGEDLPDDEEAEDAVSNGVAAEILIGW